MASSRAWESRASPSPAFKTGEGQRELSLVGSIPMLYRWCFACGFEQLGDRARSGRTVGRVHMRSGDYVPFTSLQTQPAQDHRERRTPTSASAASGHHGRATPRMRPHNPQVVGSSPTLATALLPVLSEAGLFSVRTRSFDLVLTWSWVQRSTSPPTWKNPGATTVAPRRTHGVCAIGTRRCGVMRESDSSRRRATPSKRRSDWIRVWL